MKIEHAKVSASEDGGDPRMVLPSDWNAEHVTSFPTRSVTGTGVILNNDRGSMITCDAQTALSIAAAQENKKLPFGDGWYCLVSGPCVITPSGCQIDGQPSKAIGAGQSCFLISSGGAYRTSGVGGLIVSMLSGLVPSANTAPYFSAADTMALTALTAFARSLLSKVSAEEVRALLSLVPGSDVQAFSPKLASLASVSGASDKLAYFSGANTFAVTTITSYARSLLDDASGSEALTTLGAVAKAGDTMTGPLVLPADPTTALQAATKQYVDSIAFGLDPKASVRAATTTNVALSGTQTIDGVALIAGDRVLVKNQSTPAENGIYVVAAGAWSRATDMDAWAEVPGSFAFVEQGTLFADCAFFCSADAGGTLGSTAITWSQFAGAGTFAAGTGLQLVGSTFSIDLSVVTTTGAQALSNKTYNGLTVGTTTGTFNLTNGKTFAVTASLTFGGTDGSMVAFGAGGTVAYLGNKLSAFAATTSAELASVISDETGTGSLVFANAPTLINPVVGTQPTTDDSTKAASTAFVKAYVTENAGSPSLPTVQVFNSGSGTYTTPAGVKWIEVEMQGGGGGGGGTGNSTQTNGGNGGNTTFGSNTASGGGGGAAASSSGGGSAGTGGAVSVAMGTTVKAIVGAQGGPGGNVTSGSFSGGNGGNSPLGGAAAGGIAGSFGGQASTNSGSGGGGGGGGGSTGAGGGGGAGGNICVIINNPSATYSYSVGAGGSAGAQGSSGTAGGAGATGKIIVKEHYAA